MQMMVRRRETVKPSSTTPHHLRNLKLSLLDQLNTRSPDTRILLFYSAQGNALLLEKSLPRALTEFYPLAGRLSSDQHSIDCNDSGVEYIDARVKAPFVLNQLLNGSNAEELCQLYPPNTRATAEGYLCTVQVTIFEGCGSMVLGVCISHLIGDASALSMFIDTWAAIARGDRIVSPKFGLEDIIPPRDLAAITVPSSDHEEIQQEKYVARRFVFNKSEKYVATRFVFNKSEIAALISNCVDQSPTRVQAVCAFLFMCWINVLLSESSIPIKLRMAISWRRRMTPPVPPHYVGNLALASFSKEITEPESFPSLVWQVRQLIQNVNGEYLKSMLADDAKLLLSYLQSILKPCTKDQFHSIGISSWCGLSFYQANFGWGRPIWVVMFDLNWKNLITILDTKNGEGVEAWVMLDEDDTTKFKSQHDLLLGDFAPSQILSKI